MHMVLEVNTHTHTLLQCAVILLQCVMDEERVKITDVGETMQLEKKQFYSTKHVAVQTLEVVL